MIRIGSLLILALAVSCSGPPNETPSKQASVLVTVAQAQVEAVNETITVYGEVSADASGQAVLSASVEAIIDQIVAPLGSDVSKDAVVVRMLSSPTTRLNLTQASSAAKQADAALARAERLRSDELVSDADVEAAQANAAAADAALASLRERSLTLRAPLAGTVSSVAFSAGDLVAAGTAIATVTADQDVRARFGVDPTLARRVKAGDTIRISPTSGGATFTASVISVDPVVDSQTRLASLFAIVPSATEIGPGEPLKGDVIVATRADAITIPYVSILDDGGQPFVYVVKESTAHRRDVKTGGQSGEHIAIVEGISPLDRVVVDGVAGLTDGMMIRLDTRTDAPASTAK